MPVPLAPPVTMIQLALLTAVHEQLVPVTTDTLPAVVPLAAKDALVADRLYEHWGAGDADTAVDASAPPTRARTIATTSGRLGPDIYTYPSGRDAGGHPGRCMFRAGNRQL